MERRGVVRRAPDLGRGQCGGDTVALRRPNDVEVVDVGAVVGRELDEVAQPELGIARRRVTS